MIRIALFYREIIIAFKKNASLRPIFYPHHKISHYRNWYFIKLTFSDNLIVTSGSKEKLSSSILISFSTADLKTLYPVSTSLNLN